MASASSAPVHVTESDLAAADALFDTLKPALQAANKNVRELKKQLDPARAVIRAYIDQQKLEEHFTPDGHRIGRSEGKQLKVSKTRFVDSDLLPAAAKRAYTEANTEPVVRYPERAPRKANTAAVAN